MATADVLTVCGVLAFIVVFNNGVHALAAVNNRNFASSGKRLIQKGLQPQAVDDHDIGLGELLHVLGGKGVVVRAAGLGGNEQVNLHIRACLGNGAGQQIHGIGGGKNAHLGLGGKRASNRKSGYEQRA